MLTFVPVDLGPAVGAACADAACFPLLPGKGVGISKIVSPERMPASTMARSAGRRHRSASAHSAEVTTSKWSRCTVATLRRTGKGDLPITIATTSRDPRDMLWWKLVGTGRRAAASAHAVPISPGLDEAAGPDNALGVPRFFLRCGVSAVRIPWPVQREASADQPVAEIGAAGGASGDLRPYRSVSTNSQLTTRSSRKAATSFAACAPHR